MFLDKLYGLLNLLEFKCDYFFSLNFKIQMLAGNSLILFLNSNSEENSTLVQLTKISPFLPILGHYAQHWLVNLLNLPAATTVSQYLMSW